VKAAGELTCGLASASWYLPEVGGMQATQRWTRQGPSHCGRRFQPLWLVRDALLNPLMGSGVIEVSQPAR